MVRTSHSKKAKLAALALAIAAGGLTGCDTKSAGDTFGKAVRSVASSTAEFAKDRVIDVKRFGEGINNSPTAKKVEVQKPFSERAQERDFTHLGGGIYDLSNAQEAQLSALLASTPKVRGEITVATGEQPYTTQAYNQYAAMRDTVTNKWNTFWGTTAETKPRKLGTPIVTFSPNPDRKKKTYTVSKPISIQQFDGHVKPQVAQIAQTAQKTQATLNFVRAGKEYQKFQAKKLSFDDLVANAHAFALVDEVPSQQELTQNMQQSRVSIQDAKAKLAALEKRYPNILEIGRTQDELDEAAKAFDQSIPIYNQAEMNALIPELIESQKAMEAAADQQVVAAQATPRVYSEQLMNYVRQHITAGSSASQALSQPGVEQGLQNTLQASINRNLSAANIVERAYQIGKTDERLVVVAGELRAEAKRLEAMKDISPEEFFAIESDLHVAYTTLQHLHTIKEKAEQGHMTIQSPSAYMPEFYDWEKLRDHNSIQFALKQAKDAMKRVSRSLRKTKGVWMGDPVATFNEEVKDLFGSSHKVPRVESDYATKQNDAYERYDDLEQRSANNLMGGKGMFSRGSWDSSARPYSPFRFRTDKDGKVRINRHGVQGIFHGLARAYRMIGDSTRSLDTLDKATLFLGEQEEAQGLEGMLENVQQGTFIPDLRIALTARGEDFVDDKWTAMKYAFDNDEEAKAWFKRDPAGFLEALGRDPKTQGGTCTFYSGQKKLGAMQQHTLDTFRDRKIINILNTDADWRNALAEDTIPESPLSPEEPATMFEEVLSDTARTYTWQDISEQLEPLYKEAATSAMLSMVSEFPHLQGHKSSVTGTNGYVDTPAEAERFLKVLHAELANNREYHNNVLNKVSKIASMPMMVYGPGATLIPNNVRRFLWLVNVAKREKNPLKIAKYFATGITEGRVNYLLNLKPTIDRIGRSGSKIMPLQLGIELYGAKQNVDALRWERDELKYLVRGVDADGITYKRTPQSWVFRHLGATPKWYDAGPAK